MTASVIERHRAGRKLGFRPMVLFGVLVCGCMFATDAATRLGQEVVDHAAVLRPQADVERMFVHQPRSWPEG